VAGVVATWDDVVVPVLETLGRRWETTGEGVEVEHLFAEAAASILTGVTARLTAGREPVRVLLTCASDELHSLPLHAVAAALGERGLASSILGAALPPDALVAAIRRTGPTAVLLYAAMPVGPEGRERLVRRPHPGTRFLLGGPGWGTPVLPPYVEMVGSLGQAVHRLHEIVAS
jgi:methanogenic corrinoid protein MtbC1